jgi:SAM-dependent methyltransferase
MAHPAQMKYCSSVKERHPEFFSDKRVLEIGSLNVNGSFRSLFNNCDYTGVDIVAGPDVDVVMKGHEFTSEEEFDVVCSGECFEHDEYWKDTLNNMYSLLKKGGLFFFTCASEGRAEHGTRRTTGNSLWGTAPDYYRNITVKDIKELWQLDSMFDEVEIEYNAVDKDLYFKGVKK